MLNVEMLGRSLSSVEQKRVFGGIGEIVTMICVCTGGDPRGTVSSICIGPPTKCVQAAKEDCEGTHLHCEPQESPVGDQPEPLPDPNFPG